MNQLFATGRVSIRTYSALILCSLLQICQTSYSQNTLAYTDPESHYNKGIELFQKKAYAASREEFKHYIQLTEKTLKENEFNLTNAEYYSALSGLYSKALDADIEIERFAINHSNHPKAKLIYTDLGKYFYDQGDYNKAITYLEKATIKANNSQQAIELKYKLGISYYLTNNFKKALPIFNEIKTIASDYQSHSTYYAGVINYKNEDYNAALSDLKRVENVNPYRIEIPNWIANILYVQKRNDELLAYTEPIIEKPNGKKIDDICLVTAEVCYFKDDFEKAAKYYDKFRNLRRGSVSNQVTFRHAYSLYKTGAFEKAVENFKKIAAQNNDLGQQSAYYLGISSLKANDLNAALAAFERAKSSTFDKVIKEEAQFNYAKVAIDLGNNQLGISELQDYLKNYANGKYEDEANEILSEVLFDSNNFSQAISYIEGLKKRTNKINAAYQRLCYSQGVLDFNAERYTRAIQYFDKSLTQPIDIDLKNNALFWKAESAYAGKSPEAEALYKDVVNNANNESLRQKSRYGLAYLNYNNKDYKQASNYFKEFLKGKRDESNRQNFEDALVRIGDCYLATKNYNDAITYYDQAIKENKTEKDYAMYQKALTLTFLGRNQEAQQIFERISIQYPNSRLVDDALYQNGALELDKGNYQNAVNILNKMVRERSKSALMPKALAKRALAYSNLKNFEAAIIDYKVILQRYGSSDEADNALLGLQESLNSVGRSEDFATIVDEFKKNNPANGSVENLEYESAKNLYLNEKYEKAIPAFQKYIKNYPSSNNSFEAKYFIADSYYILNDKANALAFYNLVIAENRTTYVTKSALRAAAIEIGNKSFKNAITNFRTVIYASQNKRDIVTAWQGLADAYYTIGNHDSTQVFCREIINNGGSIVMGAPNKAQLLLGKSFMQKNDYLKAEEEFKKTILMAKDNNGAEAKYFIGEMQYKSRKYKESIKTLQELAKDFSEFIYWYEKSFLLISDNYVGMNDYFMAKATLKSVIENSDTPDTIDTAKRKLKEIENKE
ncbi:Tetratricopeptide TPR_1 repeat-containing protein [Emticicia oligotrophica DSM 17448]|uniref:Tetratricopeptide TPR_1 repeat-containing protein n=1 Tax=Emticicia oligotrophica (strain DSM 17448 / CIP 109782 / MTCC 6937 / GPTSA100-15) TaxID=929562 RepID=A0ABM5N746_EMTOG|nr:tetratricopeptide repeat protein [Emticicia oligotrophica]AFK05318.1 Tetratricopeptide TPR_1 repeat-containing protein [Emticicia oligotrophica DSM 17448]